MNRSLNTKISVILPTFNRGHKILVAVESVLNQSYKDWELIVVDDGSTDDTKNLLSSYLMDTRIKYFYQSNKGVSSARNFGIKNAVGDYVVFLDSDDEFFNNKLEAHLLFHKKLGKPFSVSNSLEVRANNKSHIGYKTNGNFIITQELFIQNKIPCGAGFMMCEKKLISELLFDENLRALEDTELLMRYLKLNDLAYIGMPLMKRFKNIGDDRLSSNNIIKLQSYKYLIRKIEKIDYGFTVQEKKVELKYCYTQLAIFNFLSGYFEEGRNCLKEALIFGGFSFKVCSLYVITINPLLFKITLFFVNFLWRLRIIKM